jgi:DNA-binding transcriptional LysR family regulator
LSIGTDSVIVFAKSVKIGANMEWVRAAQLFVSVVQLGSLSAAARQYDLSPASVSRMINRLEETVDARLLNRTSRSLTTTEAGALYYKKVEQILQQIAEAHNAVGGLQSVARGTLRVHSRVLVGHKFIVPALTGFTRHYPDIKVDLLLSNFAVDLVEQNIDVDIRIGTLADSALIARKLASAERYVVAAPAYLEGMPVIRMPADLEAHNCLTYRVNIGRTVWRFIDAAGTMTEVPVTGSIQSNNGPALLTATVQGVGIAMMPDWAIRPELASGALVRLFADYRTSHVEFDNGVYAIFQSTKQMPTKIRVFVDYIADYFKTHNAEGVTGSGR